MNPSVRRVLTQSPSGREEVRELLQTVLVGELIAPSEELWLVSPWISNIALINDPFGRFRFLHDSGQSSVRLVKLVALLAERGTQVTVVTRPGASDEVVAALQALEPTLPSHALTVLLRDTLHAKGIAGDGFAITGSMNLTWSGMEKWDELVAYHLDPDAADIRAKFRDAYGTA